MGQGRLSSKLENMNLCSSYLNDSSYFLKLFAFCETKLTPEILHSMNGFESVFNRMIKKCETTISRQLKIAKIRLLTFNSFQNIAQFFGPKKIRTF